VVVAEEAGVADVLEKVEVPPEPVTGADPYELLTRRDAALPHLAGESGPPTVSRGGQRAEGCLGGRREDRALLDDDHVPNPGGGFFPFVLRCLAGGRGFLS